VEPVSQPNVLSVEPNVPSVEPESLLAFSAIVMLSGLHPD
jgi:hypothetical protein